MDGNSLSPQKELLELLQRQFPEVFTEGKVDPHKLKLSLGEEVTTESERYGLNWAGKSECFRHIQETTTGTLKPVRSQSVDFDTTQNIFIEGDNLEVLKILQKTYQNKIKMIYIDPPYNTGNDCFIYPDRFKEEKEDYELRAGIKDAEGLLTKDGFWRKNSKDAGHFHSNWLSMMYPRLFLAKNLLREDGVIFVSIDDNEVHNLRAVMDEIYGEENLVAQLVWKARQFKDSRAITGVSTDHEYIIAYARSSQASFRGTARDESKFRNPDDDPRGSWMSRSILGLASKSQRPNLHFEIVDPETGNKFSPPPNTGWRYSKQRMEELVRDKRILFPKSPTGRPREKKFRSELSSEFASFPTIIDDIFTAAGTSEIRNLFGIQYIDFPKPCELVGKLIKQVTELGDIVVDFFAGSCTTAHAVMQLNAQDGGDRKFICVQLAEPCEEESEAFNAGFKTIADIGKERIRRAGKKIRKEKEGNLKFDKNALDLGFKVFRLEESNFKQWREKVKTGEELKEQMRLFVDNVKKGAAAEDMLFEIILKNSRFDLNVKIEKQSCDGVDYYRLADGVEIVCLADRITKKLVDKIVKDKPERFTCLDIAFKNNDQLKTNTALQMEAEKIEFKVI